MRRGWTEGANTLSVNGNQSLGGALPLTTESTGVVGLTEGQPLVQKPLGSWTDHPRTVARRGRHWLGALAARSLQRRALDWAFVVTDLVAVVVACSVVGIGRLAWVALAALVSGLNMVSGSYRFRLSLNVLDEIPSLTAHILVAGACLLLLPPAVVPGRTRLWWPVLTGAAIGFTVVTRALTCAVVRVVRRHVVTSRKPTLVLGSGRIAGRIVRCLHEHPECGLEVVGSVADTDPRGSSRHVAPRLGGCRELAEVVRRTGARVVVVAFTSTSHDELVEALHGCGRSSCEIYVVPRLFEVQRIDQHTDRVWELPLLRLPRLAFRSPSWRLKRLFDVVAAAAAILLLSPLLLACAVATWRDSGRPVLFRQERVGLGGRTFTLLKFRTLTPVDHTESDVHWNVADDDRITRTGRFLRHTSLDELPQLFNVLAGQMSLVGPRPERAFFVEQFTQSVPGYSARLRVPPGITGLAQVHGLRGDTSIEERAAFDNQYIENWSMWNDVKILAHTLQALTRGAA